jgi:hypothetical protein
VIGLLVTGDGIPIAHHVFPGNTNDASTLPMVLSDLKKRFGVGAITVVADRGLISADNVSELTEAGFAHVLATRLHNTKATKAALVGSTRPDAVWEAAPDAHSAVCDLVVDGTRHIVVASFERWVRDAARTAELVARTSAALRALEERVAAGRLTDKAAIARAATKITDASGVARLFDLEIDEASFVYHYDEVALDYEEQLLAGRWVLTTSLRRDQASAVAVLGAYRRLLEVESSFRVLKDFLHEGLDHRGQHAHGHVGHGRGPRSSGIPGAAPEADLRQGDVRDPDLADPASHNDTGATTLTLISGGVRCRGCACSSRWCPTPKASRMWAWRALRRLAPPELPAECGDKLSGRAPVDLPFHRPGVKVGADGQAVAVGLRLRDINDSWHKRRSGRRPAALCRCFRKS